MGDYAHQDWTPVVLQKKKKTVITPEKKAAIAFASKVNKIENETFIADKPNSTYYKFLQKARLARKMSQQTFASSMNISAKTVKLWESGKEAIPGGQIGRINQLLKVNIKKNLIL